MPEMNSLQGKTTVSPGVLMAIAHMAAQGVPGVKAVARRRLGGAMLLRRSPAWGAQLAEHGGVVSGDMFLVIKAGFNVREVCREVQQQVARALQEMAGMTLDRLDLHVEDIDYEGLEA